MQNPVKISLSMMLIIIFCHYYIKFTVLALEAYDVPKCKKIFNYLLLGSFMWKYVRVYSRSI